MIRYLSLIFLTSSLARANLRAEPFPEFEVQTIDNWGQSLGQTALVDVDNDGDLDWIAGNAGHSKVDTGMVCWWENKGSDGWTRHEMGLGKTDVGGAAYDVDGDGWVDFVAGEVLLLNPGNPREQPFRAYEIGTPFSHDTEFADVNGDGRMDLIANHDKTGLAWFEIPADPTQPWPNHLIANPQVPLIHGGASPRAVADLDGDGDNDVVTAGTWYENLGEALSWREHRTLDLGEERIYGISVRTWTCDLDGDGDVDIVQTENDHENGRVAWFENDGHANWTRHILRDKGGGHDWHSLAVADFDNDGDLDIYAGAGPLSFHKKFGCFIWENEGASRSWTEHTILLGKQCHEVEVGDIDDDGDIDICTKPWSSTNEHFVLRNLLKN